jgi:serine/threonine-protein kinase
VADPLLGIVRQACAADYAVEREVGRGGTAVVYLARDLRHQRSVALKLLDPELARAVGADRFRREIDIAARLNHPHILPLLHSGAIRIPAGIDDAGRPLSLEVPYYVMPFVTGESLRDRLARERTLDLDEALRISREVADALDYAHSEGVVHRDIKPENILLSGGHAVIADFGIARALDQAGSERVTRAGVMIGTPQYMSPEQVAGDVNVDGRADLYALGCILYEMVSGVPPFQGSSVREVLAKRISEPAPKLTTSGVSAPPFVEAALQKVLATDPALRFGTAAEFGAALTPGGRVGGTTKTRRGLIVGVAAVAVLAIAGSLLLRNRSSREAIATVAVLPLTESVTDSSTAYLREGIPEAVADLLRRLPQLTVTAPSLVAQLLARQPDLDLRSLGARLGVEAFLAGRMRRWGDSLDLRTELFRVRDGQLLWSFNYAGLSANLLTVEHQIARSVAKSLRVGMTSQEAMVLTRRTIEDPVAYDTYLRARHLWVKATPLGAGGARVIADSILYYAEQVRTKAPDFAGGYFLESAFYTLSALRGWRSPLGAVIDSGKAAARRAIEIDPAFPDPWTILGLLNLYTTDDWAEARRLLRRGVELDPASLNARLFYAIYLGEVERELDSAVAQLRAAVEIDSQAVVLNSLGDLYLRARQNDSAAAVLRRAVERFPTIPGPRGRLVRAFEALGRFDSAVAVRRAAPDTTGVGAYAEALAQAGPEGYRRVLTAELRRRIDSLEEALRGPKNELADSVPPLREHRIALLHAQLGQWREAQQWVLREYARRPGRLATVLANPDFDGLRRSPEIVALARRHGLEGLLNKR